MTGVLSLGVAWTSPLGMERASERDLTSTAEERWIHAAVRGDRGAFARLVDLHKRIVYGLCLRVLSDPEEARDAAQETFARAWSGLSAYDTSQPFPPWLLRIARNHCIDLLRRRLPAAQQVPLDAPAPAGATKTDLLDEGTAAADEQLARAQDASALAKAVAALPERYRAAIHLFHVEGLSYKEIAAALEVPVGTVMTWLHRGRAQLRERLAAPEVP